MRGGIHPLCSALAVARAWGLLDVVSLPASRVCAVRGYRLLRVGSLCYSVVLSYIICMVQFTAVKMLCLVFLCTSSVYLLTL